jgi:hypothetical protein
MSTPVLSRTTLLYVDMLGFGQLTLEHPDTVIEDFHKAAYLRPLDLSDGPVAGGPLLAGRFLAFHQVVDDTIAQHEKGHLDAPPMTAISFADAAYLTMPSLKEAAATSARMMRLFIEAEVPVRIGIGEGTFAALAFHSDAGADALKRLHTSQFFGTAVVRAHAAGRSPEKGLRILVHESAARLGPDQDVDPPQMIPLSDGQSPYRDTGSRSAVAEINYTYPGDEAKDLKLVEALQRMREQAGDTHAHHYHATLEAFGRMRQARERAPLP